MNSIIAMPFCCPLRRCTHLLYLFLIIIINIGGCGDEHDSLPGDTGALNVTFQVHTSKKAVSEGTSDRATAHTCDTLGIADVTATVFDSSENIIKTGGPWPCTLQSAVILNVPHGSNYKVVVLCRTDDKKVRYRGEKTEITVDSDIPTDIGELDAYHFVPNLSFPLQLLEDTLTVQIEPVKGAAEYRVVVSENKDLTQPFLHTITAGTALQLPALSGSETYYWQFTAIDSEGNESAFSEVIRTEQEDVDHDGDHFSVNLGDCNDDDPSVFPTAPETCNAIDDNCNDLIDENVTRQTTCGVGACEGNTGVETCFSGEWHDDTCVADAGAIDERCNNIDDDCDGDIDEDLDGTSTVCGIGACAANGRMICRDGNMINTCIPAEPGTETCNGIDDDCDGTVDEELNGERTTCGLGRCAAVGQMVCRDGAMVDTCLPGQPGPEVCNGADDDCDGDIDEDLDGTSTVCGIGACIANGRMICRDGNMIDPCVPGEPGTETCNGIDDDCDGTVDEELNGELTTCGLGRCEATGQMVCRDGAMVDTCLPGQPGPEVCNGADDDCDGDIDEDLDGTSTVCGIGACAANGRMICRDGNMIDSCVPGEPEAEACNGIDDDCDGTADEELDGELTTCGLGRCEATGQMVCRDGAMVDTCLPGQPGPEVCNGADDDCDGDIDEDLDGTSTVCGIGACIANGRMICRDGNMIDSCVPAEPGTETCNGVDDDCDGTVDEELDGEHTTCGLGRCTATGQMVCRDGAMVDTCLPGQSETETCNGIDDDCDGTVDEELDGERTTCGLGRCTATGQMVCRDAAMMDTCLPGQPGTETCNGIDDDCDGTTDEELDGELTTCGIGRCAATGQMVCRDGAMVDTCLPGQPGTETCNGADDDCDGDIDEDLDGTSTECGIGACAAAGRMICRDGNMIDTCVPGAPEAEACNGIDDDCDGTVDEELNGERTTCGLGRCTATGQMVCRDAAMVDTCVPGQPDTETCNGIDDDCDGTTDEELDGELTTCGLGQCAATGQMVCRDAAMVDTCVPGQPDTETCNGADDDCDGDIDEDLDGESTECGIGACTAAGRMICRDGNMIDTCVPAEPGPEACNGIDDDCDGTTDEELDGERTTCGLGQCAATGQMVCRDAAMVDTCVPGQPGTETCNGADDDCDGDIDEGLDGEYTECGIGACTAAGRMICRDGNMIDTCVPAEPGPEACNGIDDDCDGTTDEELDGELTTCGLGRCAATGQMVCHDAAMVDTCVPGQPDTETCNGIDDDCDGTVDEGLDGERTTCGLGRCAATGQMVCRDAVMVDTCVPGQPDTETCNGADDDCDGDIDEDLDGEYTECGIGACIANGRMICRDGNMIDTCVPGEPEAEACNGIDDDCDGTADEELDGERTTCGLGQCAASGQMVCRDGDMVDTCVPGEPEAETCNSADDDCDGDIDEDLDGEYTECGIGACAANGRMICRNGNMIDTCVPGEPEAETCNGADDDCDGAIDEDSDGEYTECGIGACAAAGRMICRDGNMIDTCVPGEPEAETCNGADDDCDGAIDEDSNGEYTTCGIGACAATGQWICRNGAMVNTCVPGEPSTEIDNDIDDDCDGEIDEGFNNTIVIMIGDDDGYGYGETVVPNNSDLPPNTGTNYPEWIFDNREPDEEHATDGSEHSDYEPYDSMQFSFEIPFTPLDSNSFYGAEFVFDVTGIQTIQFGGSHLYIDERDYSQYLPIEQGAYASQVITIPLYDLSLFTDGLLLINFQGGLGTDYPNIFNPDAIAFDFFRLEFSAYTTVTTAPIQVRPPADATLFYNEGFTRLQWRHVPGALSYTVVVEVEGDCSNGWCPYRIETGIMATQYILEFGYARRFRWNVKAVDARGNDGPESTWRIIYVEYSG